MIILDTNVVSEVIRPFPEPGVLAWLDSQAPDTTLITSVTVAELKSGVELKPDGRRKEELRSKISDIINLFAARRILSFDAAAAEHYAVMIGNARKHGFALTIMDAQIGAIAALHHMAVATRDTKPFARAGVPVINPWDDAAAQK